MSWVTARRAFARNGENDRPRGDCPQLWSAPRQRSGTFPRWRSSRTVGATAANPKRPMPEPYRAVSFAQRSEGLHDQTRLSNRGRSCSSRFLTNRPWTFDSDSMLAGSPLPRERTERPNGYPRGARRHGCWWRTLTGARRLSACLAQAMRDFRHCARTTPLSSTP